MRGHVRKRGTVWCYVIDLPRLASGARRQRWFSGFVTRKQAEAALSAALSDLGKGSYVEPSAMTVSAFLHRWLDESRMRLGKAYNDVGLVMAEPDGAFRRPDALSTNFAAFIRRHPELPTVRFHDLRHTHASLLVQAGEHAKVVSERLGHSSVAFTLDTYGHLMPGMEEAAAMLDGLFGAAGRMKNN
jgi:site-specific recombinase XerC